MIRIFRHYMPKGLLVLGAAEVAILLLAVYVGVSLGLMDAKTPEAASEAQPLLPNAAVFVLVMLAVMTALGLYGELKEGDWGYFPRLGLSFILGLGIMSGVFWFAPSLAPGREVVELAFVVSLGGLALARFFYVKVNSFHPIKKRVLVLGTGSRAFKIGELEQTNAGRTGFHVVGYLPVIHGDRTGAKDDPRVLLDVGSLQEVVRKYRIEEVVVGIRDRRGAVPMQEILQCKLKGVNVVDLPAFFERETGQIQLESLNASWLIFSDGFVQGPIKSLIKRLFDIGVSLLLLVLAAPIMVLTAFLIYREDRGPVLYRQTRVGQNGKPFDLLKFRSMRVDAERDGSPQWAKVNDDRTTRVGRVIRKIRVDELPQVFNVLKGEMSFVGPRPERPFFVQQLAKKIPYYDCRLAVKPGITGWAQVRYPYGASVEDAVQKLQYDLYYIKNNTVFLDIIVLLQTAQVLVWSRGAR